jgi:hypothetical protein
MTCQKPNRATLFCYPLALTYLDKYDKNHLNTNSSVITRSGDLLSKQTTISEVGKLSDISRHPFNQLFAVPVGIALA